MNQPTYSPQAHAAAIVKNHSKKHYFLKSMKRYLTKRPFTEEECQKIIEVGKTFLGKPKDQYEPPRNIDAVLGRREDSYA